MGTLEEEKQYYTQKLQATSNRITVLEFSLKEMLKLIFESKEDENICISTCEDLAEQTIKDINEMIGMREYYIEKLNKLEVWEDDGVKNEN